MFSLSFTSNIPINASSKLIAHDALDYTPQPRSLQGVEKDCKYESFKENPIPKPNWYEISKITKCKLMS
jgi:hypothetical protein